MKSINEINEFTENIFNTVREPLLVLDKDLRVISANHSFNNYFKVSPDQTIGTCIYDLGNQQWDIPKLKELLEKILPEKTTFENFEVENDFKGIGNRILLLNARQIERAPEKEKIILLAIEDITERRSSEKKLKAGEEEFREIIEHSADAIFIVDNKGKYVYINTKAVQMLGYSKEEMMLLTIADISPKNRLEEYFEILKQTIQEGSFFAEIQLLKKEGNLLSTDLNSVLLPNGLIYASCRDITERKRAEEVLQQERDFSRTIIQTSPTFFVAIGSDGKTIMMNNSMLQTLGYTSSEVVGIDYLTNFVPVEDREKLSKIFEALVITNKSILNENSILTKDGRKIIVEWHGKNILKPNGELNYFFGIGIDITERKRSEETLRESEEKYRSFFENSLDSILLTSPDGRIFSANPAACKMFGYSEKELIRLGKSGIVDMTDPQLPILLSERALNGKARGELKLIRKDGTQFMADISSAIFKDQEGLDRTSMIISDITERRQIEDSLKTSEELFRTAAQNLTDIIYNWDIKQKLDWYGDIDGIMGYQPGEFPRTIDGWEAVIHPEDKDRIMTALENHIKGVAPYHTEYRVKRSDGGWRWWSARGTALRNEQGEAYKMIGSITDITEQKDIQNKIKFKSDLLSHVGQAVIATDLQGKVIYLNNAAEKIYGWSSAEATGQNIVDIIPGEQTHEQAKEIMKELSVGNSWSGEFLVKRKDGSIFPAYVTDAPIIDSDGKLTGIIGISNDITERKRTELESKVMYEITHGVTTTDNLDELLKLIHQSLSKVIYAENCFVTLHDQNTGLFSFPFYKDKIDPTPGTEQMDKSCTAYIFRTGKSLLLSQKLFDQLVEQDEVELIGTNSPSWIGVPLKIQFRTIGVLVLQHYEKENVYTEHDIVFLNSVGREIAHVIERKLTEEETQKHNKQLLKLNAEKNKFFSIIAHDLRSPFNGFINLTELMANTTEKVSLDEFAEYSKMLNKAARNLYMLLDNLLEWAQIQKGNINFTPKNSDLSSMVSQCIDIIYQSALQKRIAIINEINNPQKVYADEKSINTVLRNLLSNAVKFTRIDGKVIVKSKRFDDGNIRVSIEDNGVGISEDNVKKLFRIEEKVGSLGTEGEPSTGLGLLLCKEFVELHGQKIWAESEKDKGSTFHFTLRAENGYETKS